MAPGYFFSTIINLRLHFERVWWSWKDWDKGKELKKSQLSNYFVNFQV